MAIEMIGIDHHLAKIDIRMMFSFTKKGMQDFYQSIKTEPGILGCVLLSTCNRMELWISTDSSWKGNLLQLLCAYRQVPADWYLPYFIQRREEAAVEHLFRLAGGLESRILGEDQILTQVGEALSYSRENYAADHVLETLFRQAVTAGKKIKTGVSLSAADQSVVHIAIAELKQRGLSFAGKRCMVIGNGVMGKLAATMLQREGAEVTVTVRQYHSGVVEIPRDCQRIDYGRRMELFPQCDLVVSATVSPNYTLTKALVEGSASRPMILIDLAVPRDIEPEVGQLDWIRLFDIDSFRKEAENEEQRLAIAEAEEILMKQMTDFFTWYGCVDVVPQIAGIKREMAKDLLPRVQKKFRELPLSEEQQVLLVEELDAATQRMANKLLFELKKEMNPYTYRECLDAMAKIYRP